MLSCLCPRSRRPWRCQSPHGFQSSTYTLTTSVRPRFLCAGSPLWSGCVAVVRRLHRRPRLRSRCRRWLASLRGASTNNFPRFQRFHGFNLQPMKPRAVSKVGLKLQLRLRLQVSRKRPSCHLQQLQRFHRKLETLRRFHWFHWPFATVSEVSPTV